MARQREVRFPISRAAFDQDAGISTQTLIFWRKRSSQYAARLSILPHYVTRQVSFVLQRQLAQSGKQLPGLKLELPQLPQTRKNQFGWPFHESVYGSFSAPRCDVKH